MEEGSLADWYFPESSAVRSYGGGEYNSDGGDSVASSERARSGAWAVKATLPGAGGTRLFRWQEARANRDLVYEAWFYLPAAYRITGNYWNLFQFKSRSTAGAVDPLWFVDLVTTADGSLRPTLIWWHRTLEGPRPGQAGLRRLQPLSPVTVPAGRWFSLKARLHQSKDFDGTLQVWLDGQLIFDQTGVRTSFNNCAYNSWCATNEWSVNNYSDGLNASPATLYIDDAQISR
jgi:hypothetical protein